MSKAALPVSKAKNAYDLLGDVIVAVKEEPRRLWMNDWIKRGSELREFLVFQRDDGPACGTVACIAGWCHVLAAPNSRRNAEVSAHALLGSTALSRSRYQDPAAEEIYGQAVDRLFTTYPLGGTYGSKEYAAEVIANIRAFRKRYRTRLLATKLPKRKKATRPSRKP